MSIDRVFKSIDKFVYLGGLTSAGSRIKLDVARHINSTRFVFGSLFRIRKYSYLNTNIGLRLFLTNVPSVLLWYMGVALTVTW